jgi:hypothetical protein
MFLKELAAASPSRLVNAWRLRSGGKTFVVTPAHVALFVKDSKFLRSPFLEDLKSLKWCAHRSLQPKDFTRNIAPVFGVLQASPAPVCRRLSRLRPRMG